MVTRSDPEKHKEQVRAANRARYRATQALISENQSRFDVLYAKYAVDEGVMPKPRGRIDVPAMQAQIAELNRKLREITAPSERPA
jgi:uncharacterized protein YPO0396